MRAFELIIKLVLLMLVHGNCKVDTGAGGTVVSADFVRCHDDGSADETFFIIDDNHSALSLVS